VLEKGAVVVKGGRIASVGPPASNAPAGARTIDAKGMTVMPGFIDGHRHIIGGNTDQWFKEQAAVRMQEFLEAGYTTLMSGGGPVPGIVQLKGYWGRFTSGNPNGSGTPKWELMSLRGIR
jgi:dihydroorotase-like cyclic amidohydrolase